MLSSSSDDQRFLELLQRWQSGDFTRQDEQALQRLAESDDFRREAMEGFLALPEADHTERLSALRKRLQVAPPKTRRVMLPQIMAMAAVLLVLIVAIWFVPHNADRAASPVAQTTAPAPAPTENAPQIQAEQPAAASDAIVQTTPAARSQDRTSGGPANEQSLSYQKSSADDQQIVSAEAKQEVAAPEPSATIVAPQPSATAPAGQAAAAKAKTLPGKPAKDLADSTQLAWNETDKKSDLERLRQEVRAEKAGPARSEPAQGWGVFNEYLRQNARLPAEARDHNVSGAVRLRFSINANGDPQNFIILHSLGYGCDEEAKRLVQNWEWIRGQQPEVTIEIKFVR